MNGHLGKLREFSSRGEQLGATWTRASSREGWGYFMSHHSRVTIPCDLLASTRVIHQKKNLFRGPRASARALYRAARAFVRARVVPRAGERGRRGERSIVNCARARGGGGDGGRARRRWSKEIGRGAARAGGVHFLTIRRVRGARARPGARAVG